MAAPLPLSFSSALSFDLAREIAASNIVSLYPKPISVRVSADTKYSLRRCPGLALEVSRETGDARVLKLGAYAAARYLLVPDDTVLTVDEMTNIKGLGFGALVYFDGAAITEVLDL